MSDLLAVRAAAVAEAYRRLAAQRSQPTPETVPAVGVEALGFREWDLTALDLGPALFGLVVCPWAVDAVLLPREPGQWEALGPGETRIVTLPASTIAFTAVSLGDAGMALRAAVMEGVEDFADHQGAVIAARFLLADLLTPPPADTSAEAPVARRRRTDGAAPAGGPDLSRRAALGMSRTPRGRTPR